jgi:hypothetical protein
MNDTVIEMATKAMVARVTNGNNERRRTRMTDLPPWDEEPATTTDEPKSGEARPAKMEDPEDIKRFLLAGHSRVTLVSLKSGDRFTYRVTTTPPNADGRENPVSHFVNVLTSPDNERGFVYMGHIFRFSDYTHGRPEKAKVAADAPSAKAWLWFWQKIVRDGRRPDELGVEVWHEGRCGACGRVLTVPESIARGIGPECYKNGKI